MKNNLKLPIEFYCREDVVLIAKELLGKFLFTKLNGVKTGGMIVETEAYKGPEDRGSHAYNNKFSERNKVMYEAGGVAYVYICYGIHDMFNVVTGKKGSSHAILIRAIEPTEGTEEMLRRREKAKPSYSLSAGPGSMAKALGITKALNAASLSGRKVWLEDHGIKFNTDELIAGPRIGMNFDGPYRAIHWRFYLKGNKFVSKSR